MVFSSTLFLFLFLPITLTGYFLIRIELRNIFLLIMSLVFYAWGEPIYIFLMLGSILLNYTSGILIHFCRQQKHVFWTAKKILVVSITLNLALLLYFKYMNFFIENLNIIFQQFHISTIKYPNVFLPIGISFYTFQAMSYLIDVYRKDASVQRNLINCALYISLFPQLIAGPIVRYHDVAKQIISRTITSHRFSSGIQRFIFGLSKKVLLANSLGEVTDKIFAVPVLDVTTGMAWLGVTCYTLQIYYDFSGYSDMAIGLGRLFGFEFMENFNFPYISQSIREFWRRWHISLSTWFRDYLYIPLGGSRVSSFRTYLNLWIIFFLCGLWHGASWNFVVWGALHGIYLVIERLGLHSYLEKLWRPLRHGYTMLLVMIGWVFFRADTVTIAAQYIGTMFGITCADGIRYYVLLYCDFKIVLTLLISVAFAMPTASWFEIKMQQLTKLLPWQGIGGWVLWNSKFCLLIVLMFLSFANLAAGTYNPFIYFRF